MLTIGGVGDAGKQQRAPSFCMIRVYFGVHGTETPSPKSNCGYQERGNSDISEGCF